MFEERKVPKAQQEQLWKYYYDKLSGGVDVGYSPDLEQYNPELARSLKHSIAKFSAFKETSFSDVLKEKLTKNGKIVPWSEFKKEALRVSGLYNVNWLKTEYHQTVATANMAGKWEDFQRNKELYPNLRYVAIIDDRVRDEHKDLHGFVAPIDHPIWKKIYPPSDWGCRCDVVQTDEEVSKDVPKVKTKDGFDNSAAISGEVFKDSAYETGLSAEAAKAALVFGEEMFRTTPQQKEFIKQQRQDIRQYGEQYLLKKSIEVPKTGDISFNKTGFKEFANQPFKFEEAKLDLLKNMPKILKEAEYLGYRDMDNPMIVKSHIFKIMVNDAPCWIVVRERKTGDKIFYSISDAPKIAEGLKKE